MAPGGRSTLIAWVVASLAVIASVAMWQRASDADRRSDRLQQRLSGAEKRIADLEDAAESPGLESLLEDVLGGLGSEDLGALEDLLGEDLGDLEDLLGGLSGGGGRGLEDLLGGGSAGDVLKCLPSGAKLGFGGGDSGGSDVPRAQVTAIARSVQEIRELTFKRHVNPQFLTAREVKQRIAELFMDDYPASRARADGRLLAALGAVPRGTDMRKTLRDALGERVAGFYVPDTGELAVLADDDFGSVEKITLAHELEHALADQRLGLPGQDDASADQDDAQLAALAVVEGDATLTMQHYALKSLSVTEQLTMAFDPTIAAASADLEKLPHHVRRSLEWPYLQGMSFVCDLYARGGWAAVDRAYDAPPATTAQVLFPDRYRRRKPAVNPPDGPSPGSSWRKLQVSSLGAAELVWLFEAPGGEKSRALSDPVDRAAAWAGGEAHIWERNGAAVVGVRLSDGGRGDERLCESIVKWYRAAWPDARTAARISGERLASDGASQDAVIACSGATVTLGIGPDLPTARRVAGPSA